MLSCQDIIDFINEYSSKNGVLYSRGKGIRAGSKGEQPDGIFKRIFN